MATQAAAALKLPAEAHVIGEPVTVTAVRYDGRPRAGLVATCERNGRSYDLSVAALEFPSASAAHAFVASYRAWLAFEATPTNAATAELAVGRPVDLVVLAPKSNALRCRVLGAGHEITLRTAVRDEAPGWIITVTPKKLWTHARHPYLSGDVGAMRLDVQALGLVPLALRAEGEWDPAHEYWGEEGEPIEPWAKPIIARGKRPMFEMEQVIPGQDLDDPDSDPVVEANDLKAAGDPVGAREILTQLRVQDLRCLDAHAHLGNLLFPHQPHDSLRHYEAGVAIGELSLGTRFDGVLPWGLIDNRPFLRCLHGAGICAWRLGDHARAAAIFDRMLWLNPSDNQGARINLAAIRAGKSWDEFDDGDD